MMDDGTFDPAWVDRLAPVKVFKDDARSRVWRIDAPIGPVVVKRYKSSRLRRRLVRAIGRHPVQRERRNARRLAAAGLPVLPLLATGPDWAATRYVGLSLHNTIQQHVGSANDDLLETLDQAGKILRAVHDAGFFHRDFKASNLLLDTAGRLWMIDVGDVRRAWIGRHRETMYALLDGTLTAAGATQQQRSAVKPVT